MRERLVRLLEPSVSALGYTLVDLEYVGSEAERVLRLFIDKPAKKPVADRGEVGGERSAITVDDCARVSRQVSKVLDEEDPISENYTLEVSSPGRG